MGAGETEEQVLLLSAMPMTSVALECWCKIVVSWVLVEGGATVLSCGCSVVVVEIMDFGCDRRLSVMDHYWWSQVFGEGGGGGWVGAAHLVFKISFIIIFLKDY